MEIVISLTVVITLLGILAMAIRSLMEPHTEPHRQEDTASSDRFRSRTTENVAVVCMGSEPDEYLG